jgi:hypothetical protein
MNRPIKSILVIYESPSNTTAFRYIRTRDGAICEGYLHAGQSNILQAFHLTDNGWRNDYFYTIIEMKERKFNKHIKDNNIQYTGSSPENIREFVLNSPDFVNDKSLV